MAETILTFQSQLSGVMETVFKAAMYEITRLVEDSFLDEVTRCREQVESLKRRLKFSEVRRREREGDRRGRCLDCGRVGASGEAHPRATEKSFKQESVLQEEINSLQGSDGETHHDAEEARPEAHRAIKAPQWSQTEASGLPGPSKRFGEQKLPKCHVDWEAGYNQRPESGQDGHSDPPEPLFQRRYGMEDLGGFDKTDYGNSNMIDMGNLDGLQGSPSHLGEDLSYMGDYERDVGAPEGVEHHVYQAGAARTRRGADGSPAGSPSRTNIDRHRQSIMSDLDTLVVTFQTQLLDVMETVVKTAVYEVTRLVEDGLLEEVQRRNREVESLRMQLHWAQRKLSDQGGNEGGKTGRCVHCAKEDVELSSHSAKEQQDDILGGCGVKEEGDYVERWTISRTQDVTPESTQAADNAACTLSLERKSQTAEDNVLPAGVDGKEERVNKPSCSFVHCSGPLEGEAGPESHSAAEKTEAQLKQTQENSEEVLRGVFKQDPQISAAYVFPEDQEETYMATDPSLEVDSCWPLTQTEHERSNSVTSAAHVPAIPGRDQIPPSPSPKARPPSGDASGVTIKREVIVDSDGCVESEPQEEKTTTSGIASFSGSVKQCRVSSGALRQNHVSHKATAHEVMKLHSKVGTDVRLQAAMQHLHRPMKKDSSAAAPSVAHSQALTLNPLHRTPSTSKAAPPPPHSAQRVDMDTLGIIRKQISQSQAANDEPEICNVEAMTTGTGREETRVNK
ncbi:hypothetical protein FQN60_012503, partial [Etheostoma spectabile]